MVRTGKKGFTLVETLIVTFILAGMIAGGALVLSTGQSAWLETGVDIELRENLRKSLQRVSSELRQTQLTQLAILDGSGPSNSDIVRFSIPVVCQATATIVNSSTGDIANWGAPLTWGCTSSSCMDADDDCSTVDYKYIEYKIGSNNILVRRVLNAAYGLVTEVNFAESISDFQVINTSGVITLTFSAAKATDQNRNVSSTISTEIYLRN